MSSLQAEWKDVTRLLAKLPLLCLCVSSKCVEVGNISEGVGSWVCIMKHTFGHALQLSRGIECAYCS